MEQTISKKHFGLLCAKHFSPDGRYLAIVESPQAENNQFDSRSLCVWDTHKKKIISTMCMPMKIQAYAWIANYQLAVVGCDADNIGFLFLFSCENIENGVNPLPSIRQLFKTSKNSVLDVLALPDMKHLAIHFLKSTNQFNKVFFSLLIYNIETHNKFKMVWSDKSYDLSKIVIANFFCSLACKGSKMSKVDCLDKSEFQFSALYSYDDKSFKKEYLPDSRFALAESIGEAKKYFYSDNRGEGIDILTMVSGSNQRVRLLRNSSAVTPEGMVSLLHKDNVLVVNIELLLKNKKKGIFSCNNEIDEAVLEKYPVGNLGLLNFTWSPNGEYLALQTVDDILLMPRKVCTQNIMSRLFKREIGTLAHRQLYCPS